MKKSIFAAMAVISLATLPIFAAWWVNSDGTGFAGKGDVQLALGLNNKQMQSTNVVFAVKTTTTSTWTCDRDAGPQTQERRNTVAMQGLLHNEARVKNQVTGYNLNGFNGTPVVIENESEGPAVGSCPNGWTAIDLVEGDPVSGGLTVNGVALQ